MKTLAQLLASDLPPLDIVEPVGHAVINKADDEAFNLAQLNEPEAVVLVLWQFYGLAMNHPLELVFRESPPSAVYLALHRIGAPHIAAALVREGEANFFTAYQHEILSRFLDYMRANQDLILANEQIETEIG